jgi:hypothetical protein
VVGVVRDRGGVGRRKEVVVVGREGHLQRCGRS